ncbi:hypothetical protein ABHA56_14400, partial [Blautia wexlerae]|uniref:hypothetical protein n=1 Tax=Blautia wexlerae TaxID=418240 RepID=UPI00325B76B8
STDAVFVRIHMNLLTLSWSKILSASPYSCKVEFKNTFNLKLYNFIDITERRKKNGKRKN